MTPPGVSTESRLRSAVDAEDWDAASAIIEAAWSELYQSAPQTLLAALGAMPEAEIARRPKLSLAKEYISRNARGEDHSAAYRQTIGDTVPLDIRDHLAILTSRIAAARSDGRGAESIRLVASAHRLLAEQEIERGPELASGMPEFHYQWALSLERAGELEAALTDYAESYDWAISIGHRMMQLSSTGAIAYLHALHGRITTARTWLEKRPPVDEGAWWASSAAVKGRLASALVRASGIGPPSTPDPLEGITSGGTGEHWAAAFYTRAVSITGSRRAHLLRHELDTFVVGLPRGQRLDPVAGEYLDLTRLILADRSERPGSDDRPNESASLLRQEAAATRALLLARAGRHRPAILLAAPLLRVDGSRPRILLLALIATATATGDPEVRRSLLTEAAVIARAHAHLRTFASLPIELRLEAAGVFDALGDDDVALRLRAQADEPSDVRLLTLTTRERAVVEHAGAGRSVSEIAGALSVSVNTVKTQLRTAYRKLGVSSRAELVLLLHPRDTA